MKYLLDTNVVIEVLRNNPRVISRLRAEQPADVAISAIVTHELYYGAHRSARVAENIARLHALRFQVLDFDADDARRAGEVRAVLDAAGRTIGAYDALIAGQALSRSLRLVTGNVREFERVGGLTVENWQD